MEKQQSSVRGVEDLFKREVAGALSLDWDKALQERLVPHRLVRFGSRASGVTLPSSDLDIV